jgi:hypothetical protein
LELTENARNEAKNIKDSATANKYMNDFGSHLPVGTYELGGVYLCAAKASSTEDISKEELEEIGINKLNAELGVAIPLVFDASGNFIRESKNDSYNLKADKAKTVTLEHIVKCNGRSIKNPLDFHNFYSNLKLDDENLSDLRIIKRPSNKQPTPIWKFFENDSELRDASQHLKDAMSWSVFFKIFS